MAIYKLKNGKYLVRVNTKLTTGVYKRLNKTVNSYSEAKKVERVLIGKARQDDKTNFGLLLDNYIEDEEKRNTGTNCRVSNDPDSDCADCMYDDRCKKSAGKCESHQLCRNCQRGDAASDKTGDCGTGK